MSTASGNEETYKELVAICSLPNGKTQIVAIQAFPWRTRMKIFIQNDNPLVANKPQASWPRIEVKWDGIHVGQPIEYSSLDAPGDRSFFTGVVEAFSVAESSSKGRSLEDLEAMCGLKLSHLITI